MNVSTSWCATSRCGEHRDQRVGIDDILDVNAARLDFVLGELPLDVGEGLLLHFLARLDERDGFHAADLVAEEIADGRLQNLVHEILHGANHGDHARSLGVGNVNENLEIDAEDEALVALGDDGLQPRVEAVSAGDVLGPVELEDGGEHDLGVVDARD